MMQGEYETTSLFLTDAAPPTAINCMLDLETWGTASGSAIRSIGAVMFDPHSKEIGAEFYANITDASCEAAGLVKDTNTINWWSGQSQTAQDALLVNQLPLVEVSVKFEAWWRSNRAVFVWSHGANFDEPLWSAAMRAIGRGVPWKFYDSRCTRTAYDIAGFDPRTVKRQGTYHNALDDARYQATCVQRAYAKVNGGNK
jgi:hypothetical protein